MYHRNVYPTNICYASNIYDAMNFCNSYGLDVTTCKYSDFGGETHMGYSCVEPIDNYYDFMYPPRRRSYRNSYRRYSPRRSYRKSPRRSYK